MAATGYNGRRAAPAMAGEMVLVVDEWPSIVELAALLPGGQGPSTRREGGLELAIAKEIVQVSA